MKRPDAELLGQIALLKSGGVEAVRLFVETGRRAVERDDPDDLDNWVSVAIPALSDETMKAVMCNLLRALFGERGPSIVAEEEPHTVN